MDLSSLVNKLGHHLVEIRERALRNIVCKLDHNLIVVADLVQEKQLLVRLLEWFNFPAVPMKEAVLLLLQKLIKHPLAAQWLLDMGAVDFFAQLRPNIEPCLQSLVDSILDSLFLLPAEIQCNSLQSPENKTWQAQGILAIQQHDVSPGYFQQDALRLQPTDMQPVTGVNNSKVTCLKFSTFPWLTLTTTDKHVLSSNESSLRSKNHGLIWRSCQLLQDVVMEDFPAEIFLQRPKIVKSLLSLLGLASEKDGQRHLAFQAASCLHHLSRLLRSRLNFHRDPGFLSTKQEMISQNSSVSYHTPATRNSQDPSPENENRRPSVVGRTSQRLRGDGQDGDATSSSGTSIQAHANPRISHWSPLDRGPEVQNEDTLDLQYQQLSLPQFCVLVLESATPLLKSERRKLVLLILELLSENLSLISDAISENVWEDGSLIGQELRCKLLFVLDTLGEAILYHKNSNCSEKPESSLVNQRMAFISISLFTIRLLQTLLPVEKANDVLPESLANALFLISVDLPFRIAYPSVHESVIAFMEQLNSEDYVVYKQASETVYSIECTTSFMSSSNKEGANLLELVELAEKALTSLPYHKHFCLVHKFILTCSDIFNSAQSSPELLKECQNVLLSMMSHWMPTVRVEVYKNCLQIVKDALGVHNVTKPVSTICSSIHFLLFPKVLYEIITFGLQDSNSEVCSAAKAILTFFLQGHLVMTAQCWNKFIEALYPVIPVLQGFADLDDSLGTSILALCETPGRVEGVEGALPKMSLLKAAMRFLFAKKLTLRSLGTKWLSVHLMYEKDSGHQRPELQGSILSKAASLYITERHIDLKLDDKGISFFKAETVKKVAEIFTSEIVDVALRRSAAEQLAVITQDTAMHSAIKELSIAKTIRNVLQKCVQRDGQALESMVGPCLIILRKLVYADPVLRQTLAQEPDFLLTLFRVSLLFQNDVAVVDEAASVLCLLLFDEISRMDMWSVTAINSPPTFSLPVTVARRFHLPFIASTHHAVSPYTMCSPLSSEWITTKPVADMLRMAWNLSWYQGIDNLLSNIEKEHHDSANFLQTLKLSPEEVLTLKMTHSASGLQDCLSYIAQAVSHGEVRSAVARMNFYLLNDRLVLNCLTDYNMSALKCQPWHTALSRFLLVQPACAEDEKLLADVISFLNKILREQSKSLDSQDLQWILEMLLKQNPSPLLDVIVQKEQTARKDLDETQAAVRQHLQKELMVFFNTLMLCLTSVTDRKCEALAGSFRTQLALHLVHCLKVSDVPHFYGLPSLSRTLRGMTHVTSLPGWSSHCFSAEPFTVCVKLLTSLLEDRVAIQAQHLKDTLMGSIDGSWPSYKRLPAGEQKPVIAEGHSAPGWMGGKLFATKESIEELLPENYGHINKPGTPRKLEIISSFYVEWGGNALSYMGKGVTKSTVLCLLHLSHEMTAQARNTEWVKLWYLPYDHGTDEQVIPQLGLEWLIPLWVDRDPEVRFTSLGIGSALTSIKESCVTLSHSCQNISGGLWGTVLSIFLDQYECSMVRKEAAFILQNMLVILMSQNAEDGSESILQGPDILDEDTQFPLTGKSAIESLLQHYHFYEHISHMAKNCFLGCCTFDFSSSTESNKIAHNNLSYSEDSLYIWNSTSNVSSTSDSESTLSTIVQTGSISTNCSGHLIGVSASSDLENVDQALDQGQNEARTASLSSEEISASICVSDHCSLVTPSLLSAVCGLLENLLIMNPEDTVRALSNAHLLADLISLLKPAELERCYSDLKASFTSEGHARKIKSQGNSLQPKNTMRDYFQKTMGTSTSLMLLLLEYLTSLLGFLRSYALIDADVLIQEKLIRQLLTTLTLVLFTRHTTALDLELKTAVYQTWRNIFVLLTTLLRKNGPVVIGHIAEVVAKNGEEFCDMMLECLTLARDHQSLYLASLQFLSVLLVEEGNHRLHESQPQTALNLLLDGNLKIWNSFCKVILQNYEDKSTEDPFGQVCVNTLIALLAVSRSAQMYSLRAHFIDSCIDQLKHIHAQLNLESLRPGKTQKKKEEVYCKQLKLIMQLLRNCLYKNDECKAAALECQLAMVLHSLWPWLLMDETLMQGALQLLCVYTANFPAGCSSLCLSNTGNLATQPSQKSQTSSSLLHSVLKIAAEPTVWHNHTQQVIFDLLSNLASTQDCKCIIQKSNFLQHFLCLSLPKGGNKSPNLLANLWLKFLWSMSLANDGQLMIMKMKGSLDILLELTKYKQKVKFPSALLIIHNICFSPANKPKIISNDSIVAELCSCLESDDSHILRIGASALWALLHNYQKAKVTLKNPLLKGRIKDALATMKKNEPTSEKRNQVYILKCLENLEQVLAN